MTSVSSINKSIASLDNQNSDLTGKYPDVSQMEELLSLLVKSSTNSIAFNGTQISNLMSLLRKVLQHWTQELQQQKQQTECSEFLLQLSRLCVISLQSFNTSDGNMEKYFKILSYPLIQCYKMGERDILLTFLENSCDAMLIFKNKTNIFSCESFYSCIGNLLQSLAQFSSKFKSNKEQNIDLISRCGRCFLIILENNFIELLKEHFPIEQFKKLIPYVLESVLQYVEYSNILSVTANIELSLSNEYIHQFVISTYIKELSHLNLSRLFDTVSRHLIQLKKIASTPNTTSTITIISKNKSEKYKFMYIYKHILYAAQSVTQDDIIMEKLTIFDILNILQIYNITYDNMNIYSFLNMEFSNYISIFCKNYLKSLEEIILFTMKYEKQEDKLHILRFILSYIHTNIRLYSSNINTSTNSVNSSSSSNFDHSLSTQDMTAILRLVSSSSTEESFLSSLSSSSSSLPSSSLPLCNQLRECLSRWPSMALYNDLQTIQHQQQQQHNQHHKVTTTTGTTATSKKLLCNKTVVAKTVDDDTTSSSNNDSLLFEKVLKGFVNGIGEVVNVSTSTSSMEVQLQVAVKIFSLCTRKLQSVHQSSNNNSNGNSSNSNNKGSNNDNSNSKNSDNNNATSSKTSSGRLSGDEDSVVSVVNAVNAATATATARMSLVFATVRLASRLLHMLLPLQFICDKNTNTSSSIMSIIQSIRINLGLIPAPVSVVSHNITPCDSSSFSSPPSSEYLSLCNEFTDMFQTWTTCDNININNTPVTTTNHKNDTCSDINTAGAGAAVVPVSTQLPTDVLYEGILSLVSLIASRSMNCGLYTPVITMLLSAVTFLTTTAVVVASESNKTTSSSTAITTSTSTSTSISLNKYLHNVVYCIIKVMFHSKDIGEKNFGDEIIKALPPALVIPSSTSTSMHAVQLDNIKYQLQSLLIKEVVKKINSDTSSCSSSSSSSQVPLDPIVLWENIMTVTSSLNVTMTMNVNVDIATATSRCIIDINEVSELFLLYHRVVSQKESPGDGNCNGGSGGGILRDVTHTNMDNVITRLTCICQHITTQNNNIVANASNNNNTNNTANNVSGNENKDIDQENLNPNTTAGRNTFSIKTKKKQNEVIQSKKKNNTTSSSTSDDDVIINQQTTRFSNTTTATTATATATGSRLLELASLFRVWVLHTECRLWSSHSKEYPLSESGSGSTSVTFAVEGLHHSALQVLRQIKIQLSNNITSVAIDSNENKAQCMVHRVCRCVNVNVFPISIAEDVRTLYDQLSFTGNLSDQMKLCKECDDISSILLHTENIWFNNDSEFNRITNEITSLFSLQILTNNLQSQYKLFKPTHISEDYSLVFQFIDKLSRFQLHDFEGELGSDGSNSSRSNSSDDSSRSRSTMEELNDFSRCIIGRGAGAVSKGKTGPSVSSTTNPNTTTNVSVSSAVRAWCSVAYARLLFVLYLDVSSAFYWCRLAITISNPTTTATLPLPSPNTQTVQRQYVLVRLESFLLLADLLDHCGSPDSALGYLAEAKTMALTITGTGTMMASTRENRRRGVTDTLSGLVCLHELRILCRVGSSRVETVYDTIAQLTPSNCSSNCSGKNNKMIESHNLISMIQSASVILRKHYSPTSSSTSTLTLKLIRDKEMKEREVLPMFRFLSVIWTDMDFGNITDEDKDICKVNCGFHCYLPHSLRNEIKSFLDPSHVDSPSFSSEDSDHALESGLNLLATMQGISNSNDICDCNGISNGFRVEASFDILRAVRRRTAVLCSTINPITTATTTGNMTISGNRNAMSSTLLQFILGASSIGSSVEAVLHGRGRGANGSTALESASTLIRRACANDSSAVSHMGDILTSLLGQLSGFTAPADSNGSAPGSGAICFLALDKPANKLIIGRYDAAAALLGEGNGTDKRTGNGTGTGTGRSLVRVLPITSDLMDILEHWDPNSTLQPTDTSSSKSSSTTASQLSNQVKKDWWKKRETADSDLDVLLQRLQTQLGPWRCLLQPCTDSTLPRDSSSGDGGGLDAMGLTASVRRVLEVCVQELITKTHGIKTASSSSQKSSSNTKSPPINTNEAATTTAMTVLINWMQYLLLQHQHQHESLSSSPSRYLTTEEIKFAMKTVLMEFSANIDETSKSSLKMSVIEDQQWAKDTTNAIYEVFYHSAIKKSTTCDESKSTVASNNTDMGNIAVVTNNTVVSSAAPSLSEKELTAMKVVTLRDLLKEAGLSTVGRKNELVDRLLEHTTTTTTPTSASSTKTTARQDMSATTNKLESANIKQNESEGSGSNHIDIESGGGERGGGGGGGPHLVLLLCESLQSLPWECIPLLRARRTSRVPSLALLLSQQQHLAQEQGQQPGDIIIPISNQEKEEVVTDDIIPLMEVTTRTSASSSTSSSTSTSNARESKESTDCASSSLKPHSYRSLSVRRCWYALDPEANLPATREAMVSFVEPYVDKWRWRGFVGEIPTMNTVSDCHNSSDLFIYCGHGAGEKICDYQRMRKCHYPASFLWGCSSGKLKSYGVHDPQGPVLNYLLGGAPWVIGNLWDVTDKDIDRLSISCMHAVLTSVDGDGDINNNDSSDNSNSRDDKSISNNNSNNNSNKSNQNGNISSNSVNVVTDALINSRDVCKLKYIVGCSPVMYGLPTRFKNE